MPKYSGQRRIPCLYHRSVSDPLPELCLRRPELLTITAYHEGRLLPFTFFRAQADFPLPSLNTLRRLHASDRFTRAKRISVKPYPEGKPLMRGSINNVKTERSPDRQCKGKGRSSVFMQLS
jgi:hypothetical protein